MKIRIRFLEFFLYKYVLHITDPKQRKPKCAQYWPRIENEMSVFDHMQIKLLDQSIMKDDSGNPVSDIIKRNLEVSNGIKGILYVLYKALNLGLMYPSNMGHILNNF